MVDGIGNIFGTTTALTAGPVTPPGTVFEYSAADQTLTTLATFDGSSPVGTAPQYGLEMDTSGNLYGTTTQKGAFNDGGIFEIAQGSSTITTLYSSFSGMNAEYPNGGLVLDHGGNLYGVTHEGVYQLASPAAQLTFSQQPATATAGATFSPAVTVAVTDTFGNPVTTDSSFSS